jgi:hypothetical protein
MTYWIDDETGMILRGGAHWDEYVTSWSFTQLELDPGFPSGAFEVPGPYEPPVP